MMSNEYNLYVVRDGAGPERSAPPDAVPQGG